MNTIAPRNISIGIFKLVLSLFVIFLVQANLSAQVTPGRKLQVVYVVPKGQTAKPRATEALTAIAVILQKHYFQQLGVTFQLENPLVSVVNLDQDATYAVDWNNNVAMVKSRFSNGYVTNQNVVLTVIEGAVGDGGGSWNIVKIPGKSFFDDAYNTFVTNPDKLATKLHGFSHELGHAFGLFHTEDAKVCFQKKGLTLDTSKSLIMQKKEDLGEVYNYPFLPEEKRMLLEPNYMPECRSLLNEPNATARPHSSLQLNFNKLRSVTFRNEAGYVAKMMIQYFELNPQGIVLPKVLFTDNLALGQSKTLDIPATAPNMNITVNILGVGTIKEGVFSATLDGKFSGNKCYKAWATIFDAKGGSCQ
jgi:hypothetical protein